jgi:hypothetical protein
MNQGTIGQARLSALGVFFDVMYFGIVPEYRRLAYLAGLSVTVVDDLTFELPMDSVRVLGNRFQSRMHLFQKES